MADTESGGSYGGGTGTPMDSMDPETSRHPQPSYKLMREIAPALRVDDHMVVVGTREAVDELFRHPEIFSSNSSAVDLQNIRPLIPLQIDPPEHKKYRKILDPLFAPQRMKLLEEPVAKLVNELIDGFGDAKEIDFAQQFSVRFPSQVFLTLLGLPLDELPTFLKIKDGIIRPDHVLGKPRDHPDVLKYQKETAESIYDYFNKYLDERELERKDDLLSQFLDYEVDGEKLSREDILDTCFLFLIAGLDTVSASLDCFYGYLAEHPDQRKKLVDDPAIIPHAIEEL